MEYTYEQCIQWIHNPIVDPIEHETISELTVFQNLCINVLKKVNPAMIYQLNIDLFNILGLDDVFEEDNKNENGNENENENGNVNVNGNGNE